MNSKNKFYFIKGNNVYLRPFKLKDISKKYLNWLNNPEINYGIEARFPVSEIEAKNFFKDYWENHICYEEFPVFGTRLKVDLINFTRKIAVEVQGDQHNQYNKFFHGGSRDKYLASIKRDMKKINWLEMNEFKVLEIETKDIENLSRAYIFDTFGVDI